MSKTIDEKVVSMQFDNSNFEKNVSTSMSTLDKLKQSLKLDGMSKGLDEISASAQKCDFSSMGSGIDSVKMKFSALEVMAVTALANITTSALDAGKNIVKAFTIDPVATGFSEYELKMGSIQTIMAGTGESLATVNGYLNELNEYSDKTIYSFQDMTSNIGKFTNAGVNLEDAVMAIKGISNEAAISGANANEASRAMYNFAQALSAGYVKLIDWKSIELANMATKDFKQQLIDTAVEVGTLTKVTDGYKTSAGTVITPTKNFNDSLQDQWMTTDVLVNTLGKYADETTDIGKRAAAAAQDVKTFSMMMDTLKESAQSGWAETWEIVAGDFEEAKDLFTNWSNNFGDMLGASADNRNAILTGGLSSKWDLMIDKITEAGASADDFETSLNKALEKNGYVVDDVVEKYGSLKKAFASGEIDSNILKEAVNSLSESFSDLDNVQAGLDFGKTGDNVKAAQKALKDLGYDLGEFGEQADGLDGIFGKVTKSAVEAFQAANNLEVTGIVDDATLAALKEASGSTEDIAVNVDDLIDSITELGGREHLIAALDNAFTGLKTVLTSIKTAWNNIFYPGKSDADIIAIKAERILKLTEAIHKFSEKLAIAAEDIDVVGTPANKLMRTFQGLFAVVDILRTIFGGAFSIALKVVGQLLGMMDLDILDVTASIGDALVKVRDWIDEHNVVVKVLSKVIEFSKKVYEAVKKWIQAFLEIPAVQTAVTNFQSKLSDSFSGIGEYFTEGGKRFSDFIARVKELDGISLSNIGAIFKDFWENVVSYFFDFDAIFGDFKLTIVDFKDSIVENLSGAGEGFDNIVEKMKTFIEFVKSKIPAAISLGMGVLLIHSVTRLADIVELLAGPLGGITKILDNFAVAVAKIGRSISGYIKAKSFAASAGALKDIALAILILVGAIAVLIQLNKNGGVWEALGQLGVLAAGLAAFAFALSKIGSVDNFMTGSMILGIGVALLAMVAVMKIVAGMTKEEIQKGITVLAAFGIFVVALIAVSKIPGDSTSKAGTMIQKIAVAMLLLAVTMKIIGGMNEDDIFKGIIVIAALEVLVIGLIAVSKLAGQYSSKAGSMILQMGIGLLLLIGVMKIAAGLSGEEIIKGLAVIASLELLVMGLIAVSNLAGKYSTKSGAMILQISIALLAMIAVMKIAAGMSEDEITRGLGVISALEILVIGMIAVSSLAGQYSAHAGAMILMIAGSLLILTGIIYLLKDIETGDLVKALAAISVMELMFAGLIAVTYYAKDCTKTLITLIVAVSLIAIVLGVLASLEVKTSLLETATALSVLMLSMSMVLYIISNMKLTLKEATTGLLALTAMVVPLAAFVGVLALMGNINMATDNAEALIKMAAALTLLLIPLSLIGGFIGWGALIGVLALTAMAVPLIAFVGILKLMEGIENATENVNLLTDLMTTMTIMLVAVSLVAPLAVIGVTAMAALTLLMLGIGTLAVAIGALMDKFPKLEEFLNKGIPILEKLAQALGSMIGKFIAGFSEAIMETLPKLGTCLSNFMRNGKTFIDGAGEIDESVSTGVGHLSKAIIALTNADLLAGITSFIRVGFPELGTQLSLFMSNAQGFIDGAAAITPETASSAESLASVIESLTKSDLIDGISSFIGKITGTGSLDTFGTTLSSFGDSIVKFSDSVSVLSEDDLAKVDLAAKAGERMAKMAETIPKQGGWAQTILGEQDMATFGASIVAFGSCLVAYGATVSTITEDVAATITRSADAGTALAKLESSIPKKGGWAQEILGQQDLATFGASIVAFGSCLSTYATSVASITEESAAAIIRSADAGTALAELEGTIPKKGGWAQEILGEQDMATFGASIASFGTGLKSYAKSVEDIGDDGIASIKKSGEAIDALLLVVDKIPTTGGWADAIFGSKDGQGFGDALKALGIGIRTYINTATTITDDDLTAIKDSGDAIDKLNDVINKVPKDTGAFGNASLFAETISGVMQNIKTSVIYATGITTDQVLMIDNAKNAVGKLADVASNSGGLAWSNVSTIATNIPLMGGAISNLSNMAFGSVDDFATAMTSLAGVDIDSVSKFGGKDIGSVPTNLLTLAGSISSLSNMDFTGVDSFQSALSDLGTTSVDSVASAFSNGTPLVVSAISSMISAMVLAISSRSGVIVNAFNSLIHDSIQILSDNSSSFNAAGVNFMQELQNGLESGVSGVTTSLSTAMSSCYAVLSGYYSSFYGCGAFVAQGFASGITGNTFLAEAAAVAMADKAYEAAMEALDAHSPSKKFIKVGSYVSSGFAIGIDNLSSSVSDSATSMAETAIDSAKKVVSGIGNVVTSDSEWKPTITPVVDMDSVNTSGLKITTGISASITKPVDSLSQIIANAQSDINSSNREMVEAIKSLKDDLALVKTSIDNKDTNSYLDGKLVSKTLARPMNRELATLSKRGAY